MCVCVCVLTNPSRFGLVLSIIFLHLSIPFFLLLGALFGLDTCGLSNEISCSKLPFLVNIVRSNST